MAILCGIVAVLALAGPGKVTGEVTARDGPRLTVRGDDGRSLAVVADEQTRCLKTRPGAATLEGAQPIALTDIAVGDRVLAVGASSDDGATLTARQLVVMSRGDLAEKQERERADWRQRGIAGTVTAVDAARQEVTVRLRGQGEAATVVIAVGARPAVLRRYAPDSVKFADARPAALEEIQVGDQVRALGERGADGARFTAEQVVSGAFRTVVGVVEAVDASAGEVRLAAGAEKLLVRVAPATALRRLPRETAAQLAAPRSGGGASNLGEMLERLPALALTELKAGDRLAVSSTRGSDPSRINAVAVVAGIEPLLAPPQPGRPGGAVLMPGLPAGALDMGMGN